MSTSSSAALTEAQGRQAQAQFRVACPGLHTLIQICFPFCSACSPSNQENVPHVFAKQVNPKRRVARCLILSAQVHKILLAATSDYFRVMLQGPMRESQEHFVDLKSLTSDALQQIVDFMYSGEMTFNFDNLEEILNAANHLQVSRVSSDSCVNERGTELVCSERLPLRPGETIWGKYCAGFPRIAFVN